MAYIFLVALAFGIAFIAWEIYEGKVKVPDALANLFKKPVPPVAPTPPSPLATSTPPQATPDPLVPTPVGPQVASTAAYTDASRTVDPASQVDSVDRNSRVLDVKGGWRKVLAATETFQVPKAIGPLMIQIAEPDADITLTLYRDTRLIKSETGKNIVTLLMAADGDYSVVTNLSRVSGKGTINRFGA